MEKTVEQKLTNRIENILKRHYFNSPSLTQHLIARGGRLKVRTTNTFYTGDIYIIKLTNAHGNVQSKRSITIAVSILKTKTNLTPLLKKTH